MARVLSMRDVTLRPDNRDAFRAMARARRAQVADSGCRYWVFEDDANRGRYLEFIEASDRAALERAGAVTLPDGSSQPVFVELDLS